LTGGIIEYSERSASLQRSGQAIRAIRLRETIGRDYLADVPCREICGVGVIRGFDERLDARHP
jgi:hypothetical protein